MQYDSSIGRDRSGDIASDRASPETAMIESEEAEENTRRRKKRTILIAAAIALAVLIALALLLTGGGEAAPAEGADETAQVPAVSVVVPGRSSVEGEIAATGTISARRPIPVGSVGEGGEVQRVLVDAGDWVREGQVLAIIDRSVQARQAQAQAAQLEVARSDADLAQANLDRALKLVDRGFISQADVDRLTATRNAAAARVRVAEAQLAELRARNARLNIVAPASGLVLTRDVDPGQVVGGGAQLFTLASGGEMELAAKVSENDLSRLSVGVNAKVMPVGTEQVYAGQIWQLSPTIDESTRQGTARIALAYDRGLRPGGFATAIIGAGSVSAPVLPESAIQSDGEGSYVFIVGKDNRVERRAVETGLVTADGIVIASGLSGSERIVLRAGGFLSEGDPVAPRRVGRDGQSVD